MGMLHVAKSLNFWTHGGVSSTERLLRTQMTSKFLTSFTRTEARIGDMMVHMEGGKLATLADGAVTMRAGDTMVLVSAVSQQNVLGRVNQKPGDSFLPLTVEYREKGAAFGRIPMTHHRRETINDKEVITSRTIDRSIRPLFPKGYPDEIQIIATVLSADRLYDPDVLSINAASLALGLSDIPWNGPIGAVRVGFINDQFTSNPSYTQVTKAVVMFFIKVIGWLSVSLNLI